MTYVVHLVCMHCKFLQCAGYLHFIAMKLCKRILTMKSSVTAEDRFVVIVIFFLFSAIIVVIILLAKKTHILICVGAIYSEQVP